MILNVSLSLTFSSLHILFPLCILPPITKVKELTVENNDLKDRLSQRDKELLELRAVSTKDLQVRWLKRKAHDKCDTMFKTSYKKYFMKPTLIITF